MIAEYGLFIAKLVTVLVLLLGTIAVLGLSARGLKRSKITHGKLRLSNLTTHYRQLGEAITLAVGSKQEAGKINKQQKARAQKKRKRQSKSSSVYVLDFAGDMKARAVESLRWEVSAILQHAHPGDEVVVRLESPGGQAHAYGLASAQLERLRTAEIPLTVCVDLVAASGGYMMASVANTIAAAPFAVIGSIGAVLQVPNFRRLLQKYDIDVEQLTSGRYKRTLSLLGENTKEGREKAGEDLQKVHEAFMALIAKYRSHLSMEKVGTGEVWLGNDALAQGLVDRIVTSDGLLQEMAKQRELYLMSYEYPETLRDKISGATAAVLDGAADRVQEVMERRHDL